MKYLTFEWWSGDPLSDSAISDYESHLTQVKARLPRGALDLIASYSLHDAHLVMLEVRPSSQEARLSLEIYSEYGSDDRTSLLLTYSGVVSLREHGYRDYPLGGPGGLGDLGYDEWDIAPGGLVEHRLLFSTGTEVHIQFRELVLTLSGGTAGA